MIRPTETWQPQHVEVDSPAESNGRHALLSSVREKPRPFATRFDLPSPSGWRDLNHITQFLKSSFPLWVADQWSVVAAVAVAVLIVPDLPVLQSAGLLGGALSTALFLFGLYPGIGLNATAELRLASKATTLVALVCALVSLSQSTMPGQIELGLLFSSLCCLVLVPLARRAIRRVVCRYRWWAQAALIIGEAEDRAAAFGDLLQRPQLGLRPIGLLEIRHSYSAESARESFWCLVPAHSSHEPDFSTVFWGVVAMPRQSSGDLEMVLDQLSTSFPHLLISSSLTGTGRQWLGSHPWGSLLAARVDVPLLLPGPRIAKRFMDLVISLTVGLALLPLIVFVVVLIKLTSAGPSLYCHERIGQFGRRFKAWKFRTMSVDAEQILNEYLVRDPVLMAEWQATHKLKRDPRVTGIGWILRKTSLDELPQLWNVLVGEMSLVGPRPIVQAEISKYDDSFELYCRTRPGITGLWQINGRNNTTYAQRVQYDLQYIRNWSPWLDCYILARTIKTVLFTEGAY